MTLKELIRKCRNVKNYIITSDGECLYTGVRENLCMKDYIAYTVGEFGVSKQTLSIELDRKEE